MDTNIHFMLRSDLVTPSSDLWRPPSFPPPDGWAVSVDKQGLNLSRYGDDYWDFSAFSHRKGFNFSKQSLTSNNKKLVKQALLLIFYHPELFPGTVKSCQIYFDMLVKIARVCDSEGVLISELSQFKLLHPKVAEELKCSSYNDYLRMLHKLLLCSKDMGFIIADKTTIAFLSNQSEIWEKVQTPYIPPRIWNYQLQRLNECIDDYIRHKTHIKKAFNWLSEAYYHNKSLSIDNTYFSPFNKRDEKADLRQVYDGDFIQFLKDFSLDSLFSKWMTGDRKKGVNVQHFTTYLNLVRDACVIYTLNFSLQRHEEASSLKVDCFKVEKDLKLGKIALIFGETTKTDPDSDARWVVPMTVRKAVIAGSSIAGFRNRHRPRDLFKETNERLYLMTPSWEPWAANKTRNENVTLKISSLSSLLNEQIISITEDDWKVAMSLTPNLNRKDGFGIGKPWKFSSHQYRRTTNVNMFASNMVADQSLQWIMKHLTRNMTLYYGRNYSNLRLNSEAETTMIIESYKAIYRQLVSVVEDATECVRPQAIEVLPTNLINLVEVKDEKRLTKLIKNDDVGCRETLLGFCVKSGSCEYGGIESIAKCAGADGKGICADAIFKRKNESKLIKLKGQYEKELEHLGANSIRTSALKQEIYGIGVYLDVINR